MASISHAVIHCTPHLNYYYYNLHLNVYIYNCCLFIQSRRSPRKPVGKRRDTPGDPSAKPISVKPYTGLCIY